VGRLLITITPRRTRARLYRVVASVPSERSARPKLTAVAPDGTAGAAQVPWVQPREAASGGLVTQNAQVPAAVR
jgi:hypothetical protein